MENFDFNQDHCQCDLSCYQFTIKQWLHQGGHGGQMPPVGGSAPTFPPVRRKKWPKSAIFGKFWIFAPQNRILPPRCPPHKKKILVPPLPLTSVN